MSDSAFLKCQCEHCHGRIEFPAQYANQTIPCPHCKKETRLTIAPVTPAIPEPPTPVALNPAPFAVEPAVPARSNQKGLLIAGIAVVAIVILAVLGLVATKKSHEQAAKALQVVSWKMEPAEYRSYYLVGTVTNTSDQKITGVNVEFNLLDNSGETVGTASDHAESVEAHGNWKFKVITPSTQTVWDAQVKGVTVGKR